MLKIFKKIDLTIDEKEMLRLLTRRKRTERSNKARLSNLIEETKALLGDLLHPQGMFKIVGEMALEAEPYLKGQDKIALGLCTIGEELEDEVSQLNQKGELARAVILDAMGSVAAESAADFLNLQICELCKKKGWGNSQRFSPGYGNWPLEAQRFIFSLLPAEKMKVRLNQSCMMIPRKSVSFAIRIGEEFKGLEKKRMCETCNLKNCPYRK
jgi:cobalamin-dependent methionine synthase I